MIDEEDRDGRKCSVDGTYDYEDEEVEEDDDGEGDSDQNEEEEGDDDDGSEGSDENCGIKCLVGADIQVVQFRVSLTRSLGRRRRRRI